MASPHPDVVRIVELFAQQGVRRYDELGVLQSRALLEGVTRLQRESVAVARVFEVLAPAPAGLLPIRVYDPDPPRALPLLIYLHGGGWTLGSVRVADRPCRRLAVAADCVVASIEYRLAPETRFPGPLEDCLAATRWLAANAEALGGGGGLLLMGDSAGGNLAAAAALILRDEPAVAVDRQILLYPCLHPARNAPFASYREHADGPLMTRAELEWFWANYLRGEQDERDPRAAPLLGEDLAGLPGAEIFVAELDPLRDEGLAYAERLRAAGVTAECVEFPGAAHGFWWMDGAMTQAEELTEHLGRRLRGAARPSAPLGPR